MGFKELSSLDADITVSIGGTNRKTGKKNPTKLEGYYLGYRTVDSPRSKTGKSNLYIFQTPEGNVGVWGKTDLVRRMSTAQAGSMTRITANGTLATPNGEMYRYKVEQDPDNAIDVSGYTSQSESTSSYDGGEEGDSEESYGGTEDGEESIPAPAAAAAADASNRRAKLEALLKNQGKAS